MLLVLALIYWGAFNLFTGAELKFGTSFSITAHAFVPTAVASVLGIITLLLKSRGDVDPEHFLASNVGIFLPEGTAHWLEVLGQSLDVFWIWCVVLLAIGFAAANPRKIKAGLAYGTVFGIWFVYVLAKVAWAAL